MKLKSIEIELNGWGEFRGQLVREIANDDLDRVSPGLKGRSPNIDRQSGGPHVSTTLHPLAELRAWLADSVALNRAMRWFRPAFRDSVAEDILADAVAVEAKARDAAYSAEQCDLEAAKDMEAARTHLESALKGGLDASDVETVREAIRRLQRARKNVVRSAERDHAATELLAPA